MDPAGQGLRARGAGEAAVYAFVWRNAPGLFVPTHAEVMDDGVRDTDELKSTYSRWEVWTALIPLYDILVLLSRANGSADIGLLAKRGLQDQTQWSHLVALVRQHVPVATEGNGVTVEH